MVTVKKETVQYGIGTNETVVFFNNTVTGTLLHYCLINFVMKSHVQDPGQFLVNNNFTVVSIVKSTFKE